MIAIQAKNYLEAVPDEANILSDAEHVISALKNVIEKTNQGTA